ncbi:MAG TPA: c-type cytochrome [Terriglobia bacterium]|nr:c-type cytochrome [Terriglobia bacterium]
MRKTLVSIRTVVTYAGLMLATTLLTVAQQPAQGGKTAAQAYKNIQVLKDIPNTQLIPTMRFISTALGVECEFCHMGDRSADTPNKNTARKMMTMMMSINNASFNGRMNVTCYTCHHGSSSPAGAPTPTGQYSQLGAGVFFKPDGGPLAGGRDEVMYEAYKEYMAKDRLAGMPTPDQILAKFVTALGGEQAIRKMNARLITGTAALSNDVRGAAPPIIVPVEIASKAPNQWVMTFRMTNGTTANGFDGNVAWVQAANGVVTEVTGPNNAPLPPLARVKRNADFYEPLNLKQQYSRITLRGIERFRGRDTYFVMGFPEGDVPERLYFDKDSGLLLRKTVAVQTALGDYPIQTDYDDYRDVGGVKVPYTIRIMSISPAEDMTLHVERVQNNPTTFDANKFAKPASRQPAGRNE